MSKDGRPRVESTTLVPGRVPLSDFVEPLAKMGQVLFAPPNVKGWDGGRAWINTNTMFTRQNLLVYLLTGRSPKSAEWDANAEPFDAAPLVADARGVLRAILESGRKDIEVVAINDLGPVETNAHLLRFDSVHGRFPYEVKVKGDTIDVGRGPIKVTAERDPAKLPHKEMNIDIALECTGIFTSKEKASAHLTAGAKRVLVSAPCDGADLTVVYGVNHDKIAKGHLVLSNASCTTNCLAPLAKVLVDNFGLEHGLDRKSTRLNSSHRT